MHAANGYGLSGGALPAPLTELYERMALIRAFETGVTELYHDSEIPGFVHTSLGQEAVAVGVCAALRDDDYLATTHRGHGHCLAKVVMPATVTDAHDLLFESVRDPNPVLFIENRRVYGMRGSLGEAPLPLGRARVAREGQEVTVVTWGQQLRECLAAAESCPVSLEVVDLRSLVPLDLDTVIASVRKTGRMLVVHEAVQNFGAGAEIAARIADELFDELLAPVRRLGAPAVPMPFSPDLERSLLPDAAAVSRAAEALRAEG